MEQCEAHGPMCEKLANIEKNVAVTATNVSWMRENMKDSRTDGRYYLSLLISLSALAIAYFGVK